MREEEVKKYYGAYTDCWKLFKRYSNVVDTEEFWDNLVNEGTAIVQNYGQSAFAMDIVVATISEINRIRQGCGWKKKSEAEEEENGIRQRTV